MALLDHDRGLFDTLQKVGTQPALVRDKDLSGQDSTEVVEDVSFEKEEHNLPVPAPPSQVTAGNLFRHPDAHPIVLDLMLIRHYGLDWLEWETETLADAIVQDFPTGNVSDLNLSKLNACRTLHLVDSFWQRWEVFTWCTMPFNGLFPDFIVAQVPTAAQMLVSVDIANRIREDSAWSDEMQAFMKTVYSHDGILVPVPPVDFFDVSHDGLEKEIEEIDRRWPEVRADQRAPHGDTIVDEQLRRMLQLTQYLEESRAKLHQQMGLVRP